MTIHWTADALRARSQVAEMLGKSLGRTDHGLASARADFVATINAVNRGQITPEQATNQLRQILELYSDVSAERVEHGGR